MMRWTLGIALLVAVAGCGDGDSTGTVATTDGQPTVRLRDVPGRSPHPFRQFDQNVYHDTLLVQTSFDLGDSTFIMVASNVDETFEGLRLIRYRFLPDSTVERMAWSAPAYDSWTMLPTFFPLDTVHPDDANWVLANFGEKESWGQKVMLLDWEFMDMGFMDVALPERVMEDDTLRLKRRNVAPYMRYSEHGDTAVWLFACDSVYLYDDQEGHLDQVLHASRLRYTFEANEGLSLWVDGRKRTVKRPS
jgi:hypothetical protein